MGMSSFSSLNSDLHSVESKEPKQNGSNEEDSLIRVHGIK